MWLVMFGNSIPKNLKPLSATRCEPAKAQAYQRFAGWVFVLAGLGSSIVSLTLPLQSANTVSMLIIAVGIVLVAAFCVSARRSSRSPADS